MGTYQIPAPCQAGLSNGARICEILGLLLDGILAERFGFKKAMVGTLAFLTAVVACSSRTHRGRIEDARVALKRLGVNLRRTEITSFVWVIQAASGASLMGYAAYFFQQAGLPTSTSFDFAMSLYTVAMIGVVISRFAMTYFGCRTVYVGGLCALPTMMLAVGFASISTTKATPYAIGSLLSLFTLYYDITVGTVAHSIVVEMPSSRLRTKTIVIGRALYNVQGIINGVIAPYTLNPDYWNWKGKAGFFW
ncbi:hypothetical protein BCR34DRAFT_612464 [Clohesyomyces aquaticus]|uniref:Major facilitator superfamily domain-containing protein n=1 Tax=Clohesyomyces aquaticus TaxID=1231657 RepID=A0A1Y1ZX92_9PLEO|nr:hypothetical protein BCR34DRAFT_612464 [Clohesyomyces aquaticus]